MSDRTEWSDDDPDDEEFSDDDNDGDDDSAEVVSCPACGEDVYEDAPQCPNCGEYITADTSAWSGRSAWWIVLGLAGVLATIWALVRVF